MKQKTDQTSPQKQLVFASGSSPLVSSLKQVSAELDKIEDSLTNSTENLRQAENLLAYKQSKLRAYQEIDSNPDLSEEDRSYLKTFMKENNTDIPPEIVSKMEYGVSWRLVFTHQTCVNPTDLGFFLLTPRQLEAWKKVFFILGDTREYLPAIRLAGSVSNWNYMKENWDYFKKTLKHWVAELNLQRQSEAESNILTIAQSLDFAANKFVACRNVSDFEPNEIFQKNVLNRTSVDYERLVALGLL